jgi:hypothetical protein
VGLAVLSHFDSALVSAFDGIESSDGYGAVQEVLRTGVREVDEEIRNEVERLYEIAVKSLSAVWTAVAALAKVLLETEELDREGVRGALGEFDVYAHPRGTTGARPPPNHGFNDGNVRATSATGP